MYWLRRCATLLRNLFRKEQVEQELDEEVRAALELLVEQKMSTGLSEQEAQRAARLELGRERVGVEDHKVCELTGLYRAKLSFPFQRLRRRDRRGANHLNRP